MTNSEVKAKSVSLYDTDYHCWLSQTVAQLREKNFGNLDLDNLIEELESLGRSEKHALSSYLMRLCEHLLQIKYWESEREMCLRGWKLEVRNTGVNAKRGYLKSFRGMAISDLRNEN